MKDFISNVKYDATTVVNSAVGASKEFCMGYMNPGVKDGQGYISTFKLSAGTVDVEDPGLIMEQIVAHDQCKKNDAYISQINQISASSFCGLNGAVWGFDLAKYDNIASGEENPIYMQSQTNGSEIPVYAIKPLLDATERLFGKINQRRFPLMPGAHVICANKDVIAYGPLWVWSSLCIAIPANRNEGSVFYLEDANTYGDDSTTEGEMIGFLEGIQRKLTNSAVLCAQDQGITYERIYVGYKYTFVEPEQIGCALACSPYIYLAQNAIPEGMEAADLQNLTISQWEKSLNLPKLENR